MNPDSILLRASPLRRRAGKLFAFLRVLIGELAPEFT